MKKGAFTFLIIFHIYTLFGSTLGHYNSGLANIFSRNVNQDLIIISSIALPLGFMLDEQLQDYVEDNNLYSKDISAVGDFFGHRMGFLTTLVSMATWNIISRKKLKDNFSEIRLMVESVFAGQIVIEILKSTTKRIRPNEKSNRSFPSGHSGCAFGMATTLHKLYGKKVGIPAYSVAFFVASSRINDNKHYLSDVIAGGVIGILMARGFSTLYQNKLQLVPNISMNNISLNLNYYF